MLQNPTVNAYPQIVLAAVVDAGEAFIKATYNLERHGPLVLRCCEILKLPQCANYCLETVKRVTTDISAMDRIW